MSQLDSPQSSPLGGLEDAARTIMGATQGPPSASEDEYQGSQREPSTRTVPAQQPGGESDAQSRRTDAREQTVATAPSSGDPLGIDDEPTPAPAQVAETPSPEYGGPSTDARSSQAVDAVTARLDQLAAHVEALERLFETRLLHSQAESDINAKLHAELQVHRNDLYAKLLKPILHDIITVREHIIRLTAAQSQLPPDSQVVALGTFASFADDLGQILEDNDVEIYHSEPGAAYESGLHRIVAKVESSDPAAHRKIAAINGDGYSFQGRALAPQRVTVFAHTPHPKGESA